MPELPEVEVVRRGLERELVGQKIVAVDIVGARTVRRQDPAAVVAATSGRHVNSVARRGKYLVLGLGRATALVVHLGMSGRLLVAGAADRAKPVHTHAVFELESGDELRFVDPRTFGELFVSAVDRVGRVEALSGLGFDPLLDASSAALLAEVLARRVRLKPLLMDQRCIAGIGNIYSDEILWHAAVRGDRRADTLADGERARLHASMRSTLEDAIAHGGSSLADAQYVDVYGKPGRYQQRHVVYGREGHECPRCRATVVRRRWSARSTFFCPGCQR